MMAEAQADDDEICVYTGGDQEVPDDVRRVRIDKSVKIIPQRAFELRRHLIYVEFHDGIEIIEMRAFVNCVRLRGSIKLLGVRVIEEGAFSCCCGLTEVEFDDKLETIGSCAFYNCTSLRSLTMPSGRSIGTWAFRSCKQLTDLDLPGGLETIQEYAFNNCSSLRRIAMPLSCMIEDNVFIDCTNLKTVDLVGGIHRTVASLHLERWRNDTTEEINRINQVLPETEEKT
ncbi:leucine-rich repeat domain-containing protein, partial [Skeletonema marinoi]